MTKYETRAILGLSLMSAQAFLYNAVLFTYALVLNRYYGVAADKTGLYMLPFALRNFLGPIALGHFFDTIGRRQMIAATYAISGVLLLLTGYLFTDKRSRRGPDRYVDGDVFLRVAGREFCVSHRQRNFSARDARAGDRDFLLGRHRGGRHRRAMVLRPPHRHRLAR